MFHIFKTKCDSNWDTECGAVHNSTNNRAITLGFWLRNEDQFGDRPCPDCEASISPLKILALTDL